jgi:predicted PurR-regulated permease PerM
MKQEYERYLRYIGGVRFWIITTGVIIALTALKAASSIVNMLLLAMFLTAISLAPLAWLKKKGIPATLAILTIIISVIIVAGLTGLLLESMVNSFIQKMPFYHQKFSETWTTLSEWLTMHGILDNNQSAPLIKKEFLPMAGSVAAGFGSALGKMLIVFIFFIFMIFEAESFGKKMVYISPESSEDTQMILKRLRRYFGIKFLTSLATGVSIAIALTIMGIDFPVLWGFLAFVLNFIPSIGSFIAAIPALILSFIQLGPWGVLITGAVYFVINTIIGNVIEPQLMGKNLGISPLIVFVSMIFFGYILGPIGMLIATPLTIVIKIILDSRPVTRNLGIMLGDGRELKQTENRKETSG